MIKAAHVDRATFGEFLRSLRRRMQMTQQDLGLALGYSAAMIARLENGERLPDLGLVKTTYIEALGLEHEPELAARLIELAAAARGEAQPQPILPPYPPHPMQRPGNLPAPLTRFVGREHDIAEVTRLLGTSRLLTLAGAGGTGKTRLAVEVGARLRLRLGSGPDPAGESSPQAPPAFADGVWLAELASLADPGLVADAVLAALGIPASGSATEKLIDSLRNRDLLLLLDNCEHLISACAELAEALLRACPDLHLLATSREALGVPGEVVWRVPSLEPEEAARLFEDRARVARQEFAVTERNAAVVDEICARLDGIPLALELAAAQVRVLSVEQIAERLDDRFRLLTGGARTALPRQQTLKATLDWSYTLLWPEERTLFQRLSVFAGGWTLEAAEAVCTDTPPLSTSSAPPARASAPSSPAGKRAGGIGSSDVLGLLTSLADKSLVLVTTEQRDGRVRYRLLETLQQYAHDHLREAGQADALRERHLTYYLAFAERADTAMARSKMQVWKAGLQAESGNLRAALEWCRLNAAQPAHAEAGLRMAVALALLWKWTGYGREVLQWLQASVTWYRVTQQTAGHSTTLLAHTLYLLWEQPVLVGQSHSPGELAEWAAACLAQCRVAGDREGEGYCLLAQRTLAQHGQDLPRARALALESLSVFEELRDLRGMWYSFWALTLTPATQDPQAHTELANLLERYIRRMQELGDRWYYADLLRFQALEMIWLGERERAAALGEQFMAMAEEWDNPNNAWLAMGLLDVANPPRALPLAEQYLARQRQAGDPESIAVALHQLGEILIDNGQYGRARTVLDECMALMRALGTVQTWVPPRYVFANQAIALRFLGDYRQALAGFDESLRLSRESGPTGAFTGWVLFHHGLARLEMGDTEAAASDYRESLRLYQEQAQWARDLPPVLFAALAEVMWARGQHPAAMRLAGAAAAFEDEERMNNVNALIHYARTIATARAKLDDPTLAAAWAEGQAMTLEQAVAYALASA